MTATYMLIKPSTKGLGLLQEETDAAPHITFLLASGLMKR